MPQLKRDNFQQSRQDAPSPQSKPEPPLPECCWALCRPHHLIVGVSITVRCCIESLNKVEGSCHHGGLCSLPKIEVLPSCHILKNIRT